MIGQRVDAARVQPRRCALRLVAGAGVDDAAFPELRLQEGGELALLLGAGRDCVADVRTVEAGDDHAVGGDAELVQDVGARHLVGGGGQRDPRDAFEQVAERAQLAIFGPEIVAPLADAMCFVDRDQRQGDVIEPLLETLHRRAFGRDVEQVDLTRLQRLHRRALLARVLGRRESGSADAVGGEAPDLVVHQRDEGRNDEPGPGPRERRHLIAQRLARARRHERQHVTAGADIADDPLLLPAKGGEAEDVVEDLLGRARRRHCRTR